MSKLTDHAFRRFDENHADYDEVLADVTARLQKLPPLQKRSLARYFRALIGTSGIVFSSSGPNLARVATAFAYWDFLIDKYPVGGPMELGPLYLASMPSSVQERLRIKRQVLRKSGLPRAVVELRSLA